MLEERVFEFTGQLRQIEASDERSIVESLDGLLDDGDKLEKG